MLNHFLFPELKIDNNNDGRRYSSNKNIGELSTDRNSLKLPKIPKNPFETRTKKTDAGSSTKYTLREQSKFSYLPSNGKSFENNQTRCTELRINGTVQQFPPIRSKSSNRLTTRLDNQHETVEKGGRSRNVKMRTGKSCRERQNKDSQTIEQKGTEKKKEQIEQNNRCENDEMPSNCSRRDDKQGVYTTDGHNRVITSSFTPLTCRTILYHKKIKSNSNKNRDVCNYSNGTVDFTLPSIGENLINENFPSTNERASEKKGYGNCSCLKKGSKKCNCNMEKPCDQAYSNLSKSRGEMVGGEARKRISQTDEGISLDKRVNDSFEEQGFGILNNKPFFTRKKKVTKRDVFWISHQNEKKIDFDRLENEAITVPKLPSLPNGVEGNQTIHGQYRKKKKVPMSFTKVSHKKKSLKKPPETFLNLGKRFEEYKKKQNFQGNTQHQDVVDNNEEEEKTRFDFISMYSILSLERINKYKSAFSNYSTCSLPEEPHILLPTKALWNTELNFEQKGLLSTFEEVSYSLDAYQENITQIEDKKQKISDELDEIQRMLLTKNQDDSMELLKRKTTLWTQVEYVERQFNGYMKKYQQLKATQKKLVDSLIKTDTIPKWMEKEMLRNQETFKITVLNNKHAFMDSANLKNALHDLRIKCEEKDLHFIEHILQITSVDNKTLDLKTFCMIAVMAEKIDNIDSSLKQYHEQMDLTTIDRKLQKFQELYKLVYDVDEDGYQDNTIGNLFSELYAGGIIGDDMKSVIEKLVNQDRVDFLDFVMYIPLFLKIHANILGKPIA